ncbi:MAG: galactose mutarotase [Comamonadaceae bacterium]|nr:MAG: galactose mutarotase [Comamonadaceae bacterium]
MSALAQVRSEVFGSLADGRVVRQYTLDNGRGLTLSAINLGGIVTSLRAPDRHGIAGNIVLGFASLVDYETRNPHFGTIVGRHANRIARGAFMLDGERVQVAVNDGEHSLHGGPLGFGKVWWDITEAPPTGEGDVAIDLRLVSAHGDQGYPGEMAVRVRYTLTPQDEWRIDYEAQCDRATVVNLTHHDYFNLCGQGSVLAHRLTIGGGRYCPVDPGLIPEGIAPVEGTPFDFRSPMPIGSRIREGHAQLLRARGYDHNWVLDGAEDGANVGALRFAARLEDPVSGRAMEVHTTEPGLQFYSGNFLDGTLLGASGQALRQGDALCLETQHFPDSPNHPDFPSTVLRPGDTWRSTTVHRFGQCAAEAQQRTP